MIKQGLLKRSLSCLLMLCCFQSATAAISQHKLAQFDYSQGQYRQALIWLDDQNDSELKAKTLLKLGLLDEASLVFANLATTPTQDQFWLKQAARHFYSAQYHLAKSDLSRISMPLSDVLKQQFHYLSARLALLNGDMSEFNEQRSRLGNSSGLSDYLTHYSILSLIEQQKLREDDLQRVLAAKPPTSPAKQALLERTLLAMGLNFIEQGADKSAITAFEKIRLQSSFIQPALLGFGWALNNTKQFAKAHQVFAILAQDNPAFHVDDSALRGYAYAKQQLGDIAGANMLLERGLTAYIQESRELAELSNRFAFDGVCLATAITDNLSENCTSATSELMDILASNRMSLAQEQLQQITELEQDYNAQLEELTMHQERLLERKQRVNKRVKQLPLAQVLSLIEQLTAQRNVFADAINTAMEKRDTHFFLSEKYLQQQQDINKLYKEMVLLKRAGLKNIDSQRRVDFMQRTLWWHSKSNFAKNSGSTNELLTLLDQEIGQLRNMHKQFVEYVATVNDIDTELTRIANIRAQVKQQQLLAQSLNDEVMKSLSKLFVEHLANRSKALQQSVINTKLSRLKIQDNSYQKQLASGVVGALHD